MTKGRLEAFSDGVLAILITIMVLELKAPEGGDFHALAAVLPEIELYLLSFVFIGIYWSNHHHMFQLADSVSGGVLWANLHLLFWLSLVPFVTDWLGNNLRDPVPTAAYGLVLLLAAVAYLILQRTIIAHEGPGSKLAAALGSDTKGKLSLLCYIAAIPLAFVDRVPSDALYVIVALIWLIPDRRIEDRVTRT
jgi:uncharacterized membrane protein